MDARAIAIEQARAHLAECERRCREAERRIWLPPWIYRKRVNAAQDAWIAANVALFGAQVGDLDPHGQFHDAVSAAAARDHAYEESGRRRDNLRFTWALLKAAWAGRRRETP